MPLSIEDGKFLQGEFDNLNQRITNLQQGEQEIMSAQSDIDDAIATLGVDAQGLTDAAARIEAEIANLEAKGVDTSGLKAAVAAADSAAGTVISIVPKPAPAPAFQNVRLTTDSSFADYDARLFTYNSENPNNQVPADQYLTHADDGSGTWDQMVPVEPTA